MSDDPRQVITLASVDDAYSFYVGQPVEVSWPVPWYRRVWRRLLALGPVLRGRRSQGSTFVTRVDVDAGTITLGAVQSTQRWSWRRWRWE
jgi:hypothetical protein